MSVTHEYMVTVLRPLVISTASVSTVSALVLCFSAYCAQRTGISATNVSSAREMMGCVQLVLMFLGLADFIFAFSFLLANMPTGAFGDASGGFACYASASLNEFGGMASGLCSGLLAYTLYAALVERMQPHHLRARLVRWLVAAWAAPAVLEAVLLFAVYIPTHTIGPEPTEPWCHWVDPAQQPDGKLDNNGNLTWVSQIVYGVVELSLLYVIVQYARIHIAFARAVQEASLLAVVGNSPPGSETEDALTATAIRTRAWKVDRRMGAYLAAFLCSEGFSVMHRVWQIFGPSPRWLAVAQCATQPAQGTFNLLVLVHHSTLWRQSCSTCYRLNTRLFSRTPSHTSRQSTGCGFTRGSISSVGSCDENS